MKKQLGMFMAFLAVCAPVLTARNPVAPVNADGHGIAVHGFDVVAYFSDHKPVEGLSQYSYTWMNAVWQFSSGEHRDAFAASPEKYAPQFGGYCAWAVGHNYTADIDPQAWSIVDGKLYLNYSLSVQSKWQQDRANWIERANRNWPGLHVGISK